MRNVLTLLDGQILMTMLRSSLLPKMQECKMKKFHRACTWFFRAKARLQPAKTWKDVLHSRKDRQKECMDAALDITFACYDITVTAGQDLGTTSIEGYVHGDVPIRLGCTYSSLREPWFGRRFRCTVMGPAAAAR